MIQSTPLLTKFASECCQYLCKLDTSQKQFMMIKNQISRAQISKHFWRFNHTYSKNGSRRLPSKIWLFMDLPKLTMSNKMLWVICNWWELVSTRYFPWRTSHSRINFYNLLMLYLKKSKIKSLHFTRNWLISLN